MALVNHTPYPALAFQGVDPLGQSFHVLVARQTLTWGDDGALAPAEDQRPLCEQDEFAQVDGRSVPVQESDLCHYKPRADVLVNATAHAPGHRPVSAFEVRLVVRRPHSEALLLDKRLRVLGPRQFRQRSVLGRLSGPQWQLTPPAPFTTLPLTLAAAWGGAFVDAQGVPHALAANPCGTGWHDPGAARSDIDGARAAPRIELTSHPVLAEMAQGGLHAAGVAGMGLRPKTHPERAALAGTVDEDFARSVKPLPQDFDFAFWNAAWPDQQLGELVGDEWIGLVNLCAPDTVAARTSLSGDTLLGLSLPGRVPFALVRWQDGRMGELPLQLDTLIVEPEVHRVSCVWRAVLPLTPAVRVLELRELDADRLRAARQPVPEPAGG
jgi:hypothetical protein